MPANTDPIYTLTPNVGMARITAVQAATARSDGGGTVGTDIFNVFTAGANGSFIKEIRVKAAASTVTTTNATSIRVYYSTVGSGATTSADTKLISEFAIPAVSAANTTAPSPDFIIPLNVAIPTGSFIHAGSGVTIAANTEWQATAFGGDY